MAERPYMIAERGSALVFTTRSFRAEKGSLLHAGIYNKELSSSMAAGGLTLALFVVFYVVGLRTPPFLAVFIFAGLFMFFRMAIFCEESLSAVFDPASDSITITIKKLLSSKVSYAMGGLEDITVGEAVFAPENPDGIRVVEKIALQHGTVMPGFGQEKRIYPVDLVFKDEGAVTIFSSADKAQAEEVRKKLMARKRA